MTKVPHCVAHGNRLVRASNKETGEVILRCPALGCVQFARKRKAVPKPQTPGTSESFWKAGDPLPLGESALADLLAVIADNRLKNFPELDGVLLNPKDLRSVLQASFSAKDGFKYVNINAVSGGREPAARIVGVPLWGAAEVTEGVIRFIRGTKLMDAHLPPSFPTSAVNHVPKEEQQAVWTKIGEGTDFRIRGDDAADALRYAASQFSPSDSNQSAVWALQEL